MTTAHNPTSYRGTSQILPPLVIRNRRPTGADFRQPETGKNYILSTKWQVGKDPVGGAGVKEGELWELSKIVANVAFWVLTSGGGISAESFVTNLGDPVEPNVNAEILVNASTTTFTDGSVDNTLKTEVQASIHEILIGAGSEVPVNSIANGSLGTVLTANGAGIDPTFQTIPAVKASFLVYLTNTVANVTGDGTVYNLLFDTIGFDQGSNITLNSAGHTIFTAPVTGKYLFNGAINFTWGIPAALYVELIYDLVQSNGDSYYLSELAFPQFSNVGPGVYGSSFSLIIAMAAGETVFLRGDIAFAAGKSASFRGGTSPLFNFWSGTLLF